MHVTTSTSGSFFLELPLTHRRSGTLSTSRIAPMTPDPCPSRPRFETRDGHLESKTTSCGGDIDMEGWGTSKGSSRPGQSFSHPRRMRRDAVPLLESLGQEVRQPAGLDRCRAGRRIGGHAGDGWDGIVVATDPTRPPGLGCAMSCREPTGRPRDERRQTGVLEDGEVTAERRPALGLRPVCHNFTVAHPTTLVPVQGCRQGRSEARTTSRWGVGDKTGFGDHGYQDAQFHRRSFGERCSRVPHEDGKIESGHVFLWLLSTR